MIDKKKRNSPTSDASIAVIEAWRDSVTDEELKQNIYRGKLLRSYVAEGCGLAKSTLLHNEDVEKVLSDFEDVLRTPERNVLPMLTDQGKREQGQPKMVDRDAIKRAREQSRIPGLEQQIVNLKAENDALKGKLGRFSELADVYSEMEDM